MDRQITAQGLSSLMTSVHCFWFHRWVGGWVGVSEREYVRECTRERESMCMRVHKGGREREYVCECTSEGMCVSARGRERECVCECTSEGHNKYMCECTRGTEQGCVGVHEGDRARMCGSARGGQSKLLHSECEAHIENKVPCFEAAKQLGPLAQSAERRADNAKVVSSRLTWTTFFFFPTIFFVLILLRKRHRLKYKVLAISE